MFRMNKSSDAGDHRAVMSETNKEDMADNLVVLNELVEIANIQDERIRDMRAQERKSFINPRLDTAIRVYTDLLMRIQEMRFDLGLDEYRRRTPWEQIAAAAKEKEQVQRACYEAYAAAGEIFAA